MADARPRRPAGKAETGDAAARDEAGREIDAGGRELVHSSQLDERLRRGDAEMTPKDKRNRGLLNVLAAVAFLLILFVPISQVLMQDRDVVALQTLTLAFATWALMGSSFLFASIRWRAARGKLGDRVLDKARADLMLTSVSVLALFTVIFMVVVEILALFTFAGVIDLGSAAARFAESFNLLQTIMLLVYLLALVARQGNPSTHVPTDRALTIAKVLSPVAAVFVLVGALLALQLPQRVGLLTSIGAHQAVYVVTLGVLLEFIAMRIRLRLPTLYARFRDTIDQARRANEEMRLVLRRRALRTYLLAFFFVAGSMAFAGAVATGSLTFQDSSTSVALTILYAGLALVALGVLAVRVFQGRHLDKETYQPEGIEDLLARKRKSPEEIYRMAVYGITGLIAAICLVAAVVVGSGQFSEKETRTIDTEDDRGRPTTEVVEVETGIHPKYGTDIFLLGLIFAAGPFGFFYNQELKRINNMDEKFPDFLRDIAESARAGMTLPRALVTAARGTYGALTPEIQKMAAQVEWGVEFSIALERFAERARTPLIDRTVSLVVEAQRSGGNVVDILTAASDDAREIKQIVSERNEQMGLYKVVVYIAYFVFIAVVIILSAQFIPAFKEAVGAASGQQVGGITFQDFDPEDFNTLFFHAAIVQAIGGGLVGGVLTKGSPVAGFGSISVMIIIAWLAFRVLVGLM